MANQDPYPFVRQVAIDCPDPRRLAEFYRELLGYAYRPGDEPPAPGVPDERGADWLVLRPTADDAASGRGLAFQASASYVPPVWDGPGQEQMLHLDMTAPDLAVLERQRVRAEELGARVLLDRTDDPDEPLYVLADPAGHPFCLFVA